MKVGFTGTHRGMTAAQKTAFGKLVHDELRVDEFSHGDCIGADEEAHDIVRSLLPRVIVNVHPPENDKRRAFKEGDVMNPVGPYLLRDKNIVAESHVMIATPRLFHEELRSGTWATIRYARKVKRPLFIIWPDGSITRE